MLRRPIIVPEGAFPLLKQLLRNLYGLRSLVIGVIRVLEGYTGETLRDLRVDELLGCDICPVDGGHDDVTLSGVHRGETSEFLLILF
jgi:hypothetical protein